MSWGLPKTVVAAVSYELSKMEFIYMNLNVNILRIMDLARLNH